VNTYDRQPYEAYYAQQAAAIEAAIQRGIRERPIRQAAEQRRVYLQNQARLAELEQRRNETFGGEIDV
jgi:hypothetical protein